MKDGAPDKYVSTALGYYVEVESWLGDELLAASVPLADGKIVIDTSTQVIESATIQVPANALGRSWIPGNDDGRHPLAKNGQELTFTAVTSILGNVWRTSLGRGLVYEWKDEGETVEVEVRGVLQRVAERRLNRPTAPRKSGTLASEFRRLMLGGIPVDISDDLTDRDCPSSFQWDEDRLAALYDIANAWPAIVRPDGDGGVILDPPLDDDPAIDFTISDGEAGVIVSAPRGDTREGVYNGVIARAQSDETDAALVQAVAWVSDGGPYDASGEYGKVPRFYSSPALTTEAQCQAAADSMLAASMRPARTLIVTMPVDPRIEAYDVGSVTYDGRTSIAVVRGIEFPAGPDDMVLTMGVLYV